MGVSVTSFDLMFWYSSHFQIFVMHYSLGLHYFGGSSVNMLQAYILMLTLMEIYLIGNHVMLFLFP